MKLWAAALGGAVVGILGSAVVAQVWDVWARLDRIEHYLSQVSQLLRG